MRTRNQALACHLRLQAQKAKLERYLEIAEKAGHPRLKAKVEKQIEALARQLSGR